MLPPQRSGIGYFAVTCSVVVATTVESAAFTVTVSGYVCPAFEPLVLIVAWK